MGIGIDNDTMKKLQELQQLKAKTSSQGNNNAGVDTDYNNAMSDNGSIFNLVAKPSSQTSSSRNTELTDLTNINKHKAENRMQSIAISDASEEEFDFDIDSLDTDNMEANASAFMSGNDARIAGLQKTAEASDAAGEAINAQTIAAAGLADKSHNSTTKLNSIVNQNVAKINQKANTASQQQKIADQKLQANDKLDAENAKLNKEIDSLVQQANNGADGVGEKSVYNLKTAGSIEAEKNPQAQSKNDQSKGSGLIGVGAKTSSQKSSLINGTSDNKADSANNNQQSRATTGDAGVDAQIRQKEAKIASNNSTKTSNSNAAKTASNNATKANKEAAATKSSTSAQVAETQSEITVSEEENTLDDVLAAAEQEAIAERIEALEGEKSMVSAAAGLFGAMKASGGAMSTIGDAKIAKGETQEIKGTKEDVEGQEKDLAGQTEQTAGEAAVAAGEAAIIEGMALSAAAGAGAPLIAEGEAQVAEGNTQIIHGLAQMAEGKALKAQGKADIAAGKTEKGEGEILKGNGERLQGLSELGTYATTAANIEIAATEASVSGDLKYATDAAAQAGSLAGEIATDYADTVTAQGKVDNAGKKGGDKKAEGTQQQPQGTQGTQGTQDTDNNKKTNKKQ